MKSSRRSVLRHGQRHTRQGGGVKQLGKLSGGSKVSGLERSMIVLGKEAAAVRRLAQMHREFESLRLCSASSSGVTDFRTKKR
jgi:hypothetical protein